MISENRLIESDNDTPDTDESDIEDVDFMNDKIGSEQRRIRHREKLEEDKNRKIESRRTWLLKQIKNCERKETVRIRFISGSNLGSLTLRHCVGLHQSAPTLEIQSLGHMVPVQRIQSFRTNDGFSNLPYQDTNFIF